MFHPQRQRQWGRKEVGVPRGSETSQVGSWRLAPEPQAPAHSML